MQKKAFKISSFDSRAEEFEFQWWDHAFNKAVKSVKVEEGQDGQVKVGLTWKSHSKSVLISMRSDTFKGAQ